MQSFFMRAGWVTMSPMQPSLCTRPSSTTAGWDRTRTAIRRSMTSTLSSKLVYGRLKAAFREYRKLKSDHQPTAAVEHAIIFCAGWMGHYVADGSQPLHTTIQYNGWVGPNPNGYTTQHDIHAQFETAYVGANIKANDFAGFVHAPERIEDPFAGYVGYLRQSNGLVEKVYALEKAGGFREKGSQEAFEFTTHRLAAGSQMLLNLWYTAWLDSATAPSSPVRPDPAPGKK